MDLQGCDPMSVTGYSDIDMKPKEAWVDDMSPLKSLGIGATSNSKQSYPGVLTFAASQHDSYVDFCNL